MAESLNELLGIDETEKRYTEADLVDEYAKAMTREREGQTVEWGYRRIGEPDHLIRVAQNAERARNAGSTEGFETVYRLVKPWTLDED